MANRRIDSPPPKHEYQDSAGCLTRLFWIAGGNVALFTAAVSIYKSPGWSIADPAFWLIVLLMIGARYVDIVRYQGMTVDGEPATAAHFKRYVLTLLVAAITVWTVARALGLAFPWKP